MRKILLTTASAAAIYAMGALPLATPAEACGGGCVILPNVPPTPPPVAAPAAPASAPRPVAPSHRRELRCATVAAEQAEAVWANFSTATPSRAQIATARRANACPETVDEARDWDNQAVEAERARAALNRQQALVALLNARTPAAAERRTEALAALANAGFTPAEAERIRNALNGPGDAQRQLAVARAELVAIMTVRALPPTS